MSLTIRPAVPGEAALVLGFVRELAVYEKLEHEVDEGSCAEPPLLLLSHGAP